MHYYFVNYTQNDMQELTCSYNYRSDVTYIATLEMRAFHWRVT